MTVSKPYTRPVRAEVLVANVEKPVLDDWDLELLNSQINIMPGLASIGTWH
jgi:hypothetical protein